MPRFAAKQTDGFDVRLQTVLAQRQQLLRRVGHREQPACGLVHPDIGGLGLQQHGRQKLKHRAVLQLGHRQRVGGLERGKKAFNGGWGHETE